MQSNLKFDFIIKCNDMNNLRTIRLLLIRLRDVMSIESTFVTEGSRVSHRKIVVISDGHTCCLVGEGVHKQQHNRMEIFEARTKT